MENTAAGLVMTKQPNAVLAPEDQLSEVLLEEEKWRFCSKSMKTHLSGRDWSQTGPKQTRKPLEQAIAIEGNLFQRLRLFGPGCTLMPYEAAASLLFSHWDVRSEMSALGMAEINEICLKEEDRCFNFAFALMLWGTQHHLTMGRQRGRVGAKEWSTSSSPFYFQPQVSPPHTLKGDCFHNMAFLSGATIWSIKHWGV